MNLQAQLASLKEQAAAAAAQCRIDINGTNNTNPNKYLPQDLLHQYGWFQSENSGMHHQFDNMISNFSNPLLFSNNDNSAGEQIYATCQDEQQPNEQQWVLPDDDNDMDDLQSAHFRYFPHS